MSLKNCGRALTLTIIHCNHHIIVIIIIMSTYCCYMKALYITLYRFVPPPTAQCSFQYGHGWVRRSFDRLMCMGLVIVVGHGNFLQQITQDEFRLIW